MPVWISSWPHSRPDTGFDLVLLLPSPPYREEVYTTTPPGKGDFKKVLTEDLFSKEWQQYVNMPLTLWVCIIFYSSQFSPEGGLW